MTDLALRPTAPHAMWLYHPNKPDGVLFEEGSELPIGEGWAHEPPGTVAPEPEDMTGKIVRAPPPPPPGAARPGEPMNWDAIFYHPIEARDGRLFPKGATHPESPWTDNPGDFGHEASAEALSPVAAEQPVTSDEPAPPVDETALMAEIDRLAPPPNLEPETGPTEKAKAVLARMAAQAQESLQVAELDEDGEVIAPMSAAGPDEATPAVDIPEGWEGLPHFNKMSLAKAILRARGDDVPKALNKENTTKVVQDELDRRNTSA